MADSSDNPYQSPQASGCPFAPITPFGYVRPRGLMGHIRAVAILMIIQGALEFLMGFGLIGLLFFMMTMLKEMKHDGSSPNMPFLPIVVIYGSMAAAGFLASLLHIWAGIKNLRFRGRTFGIAALACGCLSVFTFYCSLTTIALAVYGLIVYLNRESTEAFQRGESGQTPDQVYAAFQ
jgi:hypothetical protein